MAVATLDKQKALDALDSLGATSKEDALAALDSLGKKSAKPYKGATIGPTNMGPWGLWSKARHLAGEVSAVVEGAGEGLSQSLEPRKLGKHPKGGEIASYIAHGIVGAVTSPFTIAGEVAAGIAASSPTTPIGSKSWKKNKQAIVGALGEPFSWPGKALKAPIEAVAPKSKEWFTKPGIGEVTSLALDVLPYVAVGALGKRGKGEPPPPSGGGGEPVSAPVEAKVTAEVPPPPQFTPAQQTRVWNKAKTHLNALAKERGDMPGEKASHEELTAALELRQGHLEQFRTFLDLNEKIPATDTTSQLIVDHAKTLGSEMDTLKNRLADIEDAARADELANFNRQFNEEHYGELADYTIKPQEGSAKYRIRSKGKTPPTIQGEHMLSDVAAAATMDEDAFRKLVTDHIGGSEKQIVDLQGNVVRNFGEIHDTITGAELNALKESTGLKPTPKARGKPIRTKRIVAAEVAPVEPSGTPTLDAAKAHLESVGMGQSTGDLRTAFNTPASRAGIEAALSGAGLKPDQIKQMWKEAGVVEPAAPKVASAKKPAAPIESEQSAMKQVDAWLAEQDAKAQSDIGRQGSGGSQSGRITLDTMFKMAGLGAAGLSGVTLYKKLQDQPESEPQKANEKLPFHSGSAYGNLIDLMGIGNSFGYGVLRQAANPQAPGIREAIAKKRAGSDVIGFAGLPFDIGGDPGNWIPLSAPLEISARVLGRTRAGARIGLGFTKNAAELGKRLSEVGILRHAFEMLEGPLGMPVVRGLERGAYDTFQRLQDKAIITTRKIEARAGDLLQRIHKSGGPTLAEDVASVIDAGLTPGGRPITNRQALGLAKKRRLEQIAAEKGREYANTVSKFAGEWRDFDAELGQGLVDVDMLSQKTADMWKGAHIRQVYRRFEDVDSWLEDFAASNPKRGAQLKAAWESFKRSHTRTIGELDLSAVYKRNELPKEIRDILEVKDAATRITKGTQKAADLYSRAKMYEDVAGEIALDTEKFDALAPHLKNRYGYVPADINKATGRPIYGKLAGMFVPKNILFELSATLPKDDVLPLLRKMVSLWKLGKVPLSVSTQARNFLTNIVLADVLGDVSPHRVDLYGSSLKSMLSKQGKYYDEAINNAVFMHDTLTAQELRDALKMFESTGGKLDMLKRAVAYVPKKASDLYQFNEQWFKMTVYTGARERGLDIADAAKMADDALFNYRKLPRGLDALRRYGVMPFIAFPVKAIPPMTKAIFTKTGRVSKYVKGARAVESMTPQEQRDREGTLLPPYYNLTHVRIPGKAARYADLSYLNPYQDLQQGEARGPLASVLSKVSPAILTPFELALNKSLFTNREIVPPGMAELNPDKAALLQREYVAQGVLPSMTPPIPGVLPKGGYGYQGMFGDKTNPSLSYPQGRERTVGERAAYAGGVKIRQPDFASELSRRTRRLSDLRKNANKQIADSLRSGANKKELKTIVTNYQREAQAIAKGEK